MTNYRRTWTFGLPWKWSLSIKSLCKGTGSVFRRSVKLLKLSATFCVYLHTLYPFFCLFFWEEACSIYKDYQVCKSRKGKDWCVPHLFRGLLHWINICHLISLIGSIYIWRNEDTVWVYLSVSFSFYILWPFHNLLVFLFYVNSYLMQMQCQRMWWIKCEWCFM